MYLCLVTCQIFRMHRAANIAGRARNHSKHGERGLFFFPAAILSKIYTLNLLFALGGKKGVVIEL